MTLIAHSKEAQSKATATEDAYQRDAKQKAGVSRTSCHLV